MTTVNKRTIAIALLATALATVSAAFIFSGTKAPLTPPSPHSAIATRGEGGVKHLATLMSPAFYDEAYKNEPTTIPALPETVGGIVNHHLLAAPLLPRTALAVWR